MRTLGLVVEYDGREFHGFQRQGNLRTVQSVLEQAVSCVFGHEAKVTGAGRTDAGVHALGQVVSTRCEGSIPTDRIQVAVNSVLPADIAVKSVREMPEWFHAQRSAKSKVYKYVFTCGSYVSPFLERYALAVKERIDTEAMSRAAQCFTGTHDFSAFRAAGSSVKTATRTVLAAGVSVRECHGTLVEFEVEANGFLYNMVRIMAGTLLEVGKARLSPESMAAIIQSRQRSMAGPTLPPHGLWLVAVHYGEGVSLTGTPEVH